MNLELISRHPKAGKKKSTPLLFVHGAFCGAWIWDEHFLPYFAEKGFEVHAVSLRGHGESDGRALLPLAGLADYVEDVRKTVEAMDRPPILIGHSMGGVIIQWYLQNHAVPGAVLLGAGPPYGMIASAAVTFVSNPVVSTQISLMPLLQLFGSNPAFMEMTRKVFFSDRMPKEKALEFLRRTQFESPRAVLELTWPHLPRNQGTPLLVLGAEKDCLIPPYVTHLTASAYKTEAEIIPHMGHAMMVETGWEEVADRIIGWVNER